MIILHIPSWFPNENSPFSGIFSKKHIEAISAFGEYEHVVVNWHDSKFASLKRPIEFVGCLINRFRKVKVDSQQNIKYLRYSHFVSHELFFGDKDEQVYNSMLMVLRENVKFEDVCLIHAHVTYPGGYLARKLSRQIGIPYIISEHMGDFPFIPYRVPQILNKKLVPTLNDAAKIIAVSRQQRKEISHYSDHERISVIPNVIDEREFLPRKEPLNEARRFVLVGLIKPVKGIDILLNAIAILLQDGFNGLHFDIVGDGPVIELLQRKADLLGVGKNITWHGAKNHQEIIAILRTADCFVSASRHESFGVAIVEALACGLPVIATRCGGPEDIVNQDNGILVEKEDPISLADGIRYMVRNFRSFDSNKIRADYESKYTRSIVGGSYNKVYRDILKRSRSELQQ